MAGRWANAALKDQHWPEDLRLASGTLSADFRDRITAGAVARHVTQASTLTFGLQNGDRSLTSHWGADPLGPSAPKFVYGIPSGFQLVKIDKRADTLSLTAEDAVINKLRGYKGPKAQAKNTRTRVDFARQLCAEASVPIIADSRAAPLTAPVSRGGATTGTDTKSGTSAAASSGSGQQDEDSWTCLTRLASDVGWYCFSDGTSVIFGPGYWLLAGAPAMTIREHTDGIDDIDGSLDVGKPVSSLTVVARASLWQADPGARVDVAAGMGPLSGRYIVTELNRQNLASDQLSVTLSVQMAVKREPSSSSAGTTDAKLVEVVRGTVPDPVWQYLLDEGHTAAIRGGRESVWVPPDDLALARQFGNGYSAGSTTSGSSGHAGMVRTEDGTWVPASYYR